MMMPRDYTLDPPREHFVDLDEDRDLWPIFACHAQAIAPLMRMMYEELCSTARAAYGPGSTVSDEDLHREYAAIELAGDILRDIEG